MDLKQQQISDIVLSRYRYSNASLSSKYVSSGHLNFLRDVSRCTFNYASCPQRLLQVCVPVSHMQNDNHAPYLGTKEKCNNLNSVAGEQDLLS